MTSVVTTGERGVGPTPEQVTDLRRAVRVFYDLQRLRMQSGARNNSNDDIELSDDSQEFLGAVGEGLHTIEKNALKQVKRCLKAFPIYNDWLKHQKGIGPTMAGVLLAYIDIEKAPTASAMWRFCGLGVDKHGRADRRRRGEKTAYNPFVKTKMFVLGESLMRAQGPLTDFYYNYKTRKQNTMVPRCTLCRGEGTYVPKAGDDAFVEGKTQRARKCKNCGGTGGPAPWGNSDAHRHVASMRYMVKMFLLQLWLEWRTKRGLPVRVPYSEQYLGLKHHETIN